MAPELVADVLTDARSDRYGEGRPAGLPLFTAPVAGDPALSRRLRRLHGLLLNGATRLEAQELLMGTVLAMVERHAKGAGVSRAPWRGVPGVPGPPPAVWRGAVNGGRRATAASGFADQSRLTRWFHRSYGITPGVYQRGA